ncbi:MAG: hypothetical protein EP329_16040 [Deltaproteobacteria bacterium]|nr:MAG: hypothetical protein EP329_16040 [Deltaproteobacteria bacterium]
MTLVRGPEWTASDWIGGFLFADLGVLVGGVVGGYTGALLGARDLDEVRPAFRIGAALVAPLFVAGGVTVYESKHHNGAYGAALVGAYVGMGAALGLDLLAGEDRGDEVGLAAGLILPALGATVGYYLSRETYTRTVPASGALVDVGRDGVVRLSVPNILVIPTTDDTVVSVTVLGGAL